MKKHMVIVFLLFAFNSYSQPRTLVGLDPASGQAGFLYRDRGSTDSLYAAAIDTLVWERSGTRFTVAFEIVRHSVFTATEGGTKSGIVRSFIYILTAASPLTNYTIEIPDIASDPDLLDNDIIEFMFEQSVTNISYSNGTIIGGLATATVGSYLKLIYRASNDTWYAGGK